jgi:uncharacterized protein involved in type VI secretion and phage assembly
VPELSTLSPEVTVDGSPLDSNAQLVSARVESGLCVLSRATLRFSDAGFQLSASNRFALGAEVKVLAGPTELITGLVTGVSIVQHSDEGTDFVVTVDDKGCRLARQMTPATYLDMTYSSVIQKICRDAGLTPKVSGAALNQANTYQLRTGSGLDYIDHIARRTGSVWWVEDNTVHVAPAGTADGEVGLELGEDLVHFSVRASGLRPTASSVTGWDQQQQQPIVGTGSAEASVHSTFVSAYLDKGPDKLGDGSASTGDQFPMTRDEADAVASALLDDSQAGAIVARGECWVNPAIRLGVTVNISGAGPASGKYLVSEVEHVLTPAGYYTRFVAGPRRPTGLVDTLGPPPPDPGLSIPGLIVGKVTDNNDPDGNGRVKVKFTALDGAVESAWSRVVTIGAGAERGFVVQPEVNDEVLVGFEYGDTRRPVVIGGLFSPNNKLPEAGNLVANGKVDYRRITSRKKHVIEIADGEEPGTQYIKLGLGTAAHTLLLGTDEFSLEVAQGKPVTIKAGDAKFQISAAGDVTIEGNNITLKARQNLQLEGGIGAVLKSNAQTQVQGGMLDLKGEGTASVDGGGALTLKGGMVQIN